MRVTCGIAPRSPGGFDEADGFFCLTSLFLAGGIGLGEKLPAASVDGDVLEPAENPKLVSLLALWNRIRGDREFPARHDMGIEAFQPWFGHIAIIRLLDKPPPRLLVTLSGIELVKIFGADFTGKCLEDVVPRSAVAAVAEPYARCVAVRRPVHSRLRPGILRGNFHHLDRLLLPCSDDGKTIDTIIVGIYASELDTATGSVFGPR
jgi:hypothetical protein